MLLNKCLFIDTYDVLLCSAGMFPGSIIPQSFKELIRVVKPGETHLIKNNNIN